MADNLARTAYEAYRTYVSNIPATTVVSPPEWETLPKALQKAWQASAEAVDSGRDRKLTEDHIFPVCPGCSEESYREIRHMPPLCRTAAESMDEVPKHEALPMPSKYILAGDDYDNAEHQGTKFVQEITPEFNKLADHFGQLLSEKLRNLAVDSLMEDVTSGIRDAILWRTRQIIQGMLCGGEQARGWVQDYDLAKFRNDVYEANRAEIQNQIIEDQKREINRLRARVGDGRF